MFGALYYLLFRPQPQEFLIKALLLAAAGLSFGYLALPNVRDMLAALIEQNKLALALTYGSFELLVLGLADDRTGSLEPAVLCCPVPRQQRATWICLCIWWRAPCRCGTPTNGSAANGATASSVPSTS